MIDLEPTVQVAIVGGVFGVLAELLRRQHKRLGEVKEHVANSHTTNLRDDIDKVLAGLGQVIETQRQHGKEISGIREEIRHERVERMDVERRLDQHMVDVSR
ncbi:DUF2746 domain-containing protein [Micromonospora sp. GCM10011541]|uniref:DUF2746 domain-containing protein n=1 Tax=Micromonospora sp. GCM10011541 TaxID=3317336 RepID=UPI00360890C0